MCSNSKTSPNVRFQRVWNNIHNDSRWQWIVVFSIEAKQKHRASACSAKSENIDKNIEEAVEQKVEEYLDKLQEREQRKLTIIVSNLRGKYTAEEKKQEDGDMG